MQKNSKKKKKMWPHQTKSPKAIWLFSKLISYLCLSFLGLLEQNTIDWVASITHIYFLRVWKLEIQDWGAGRVGVTDVPGHGWSPSHCVLMWPFLSMHAFSFFSPKGINFFMRVLPSGPQGNLITFPKPTFKYHYIES